jgi:hypothetical protein
LQATFFSIDSALDRVEWYRLSGYRIDPECVPCLLPCVRFAASSPSCMR